MQTSRDRHCLSLDIRVSMSESKIDSVSGSVNGTKYDLIVLILDAVLAGSFSEALNEP